MVSSGVGPAREGVEHLFLGDLTRALLRSGRRCEVLRAEYDAAGYDLVLEADGIVRHVQLKAMRADGKRAHVDINLELARKPSGCVIWMLVDPATFTTVRYRWFGGAPGEPLPPLGERPVRHAKADSQGVKAERPALRQLSRSRFTLVDKIDALLERLFGDAVSRDLHRLREHLTAQPALPRSAPDWLKLVRLGDFGAMPEQIDEDELVQFSHLVDGYELAGLTDPAAVHAALSAPAPRFDLEGGLASDLWAAVFIEHRRQRFAGLEAGPDDEGWLSELYGRLRATLSHSPVR